MLALRLFALHLESVCVEAPLTRQVQRNVMPRCKTHYSRKAARRVLDALMRLGGKGTTAQIAEITGGCATHSDIHSLRTWLREECGFLHDDALDAVRAVPLGLNASGRNIYRYELRNDVKYIHRLFRTGAGAPATRETAGGEGAKSPARSPAPRPRKGTGTLTPLGSLSPSALSPSAPERQGSLFETRLPGQLQRGT